VILPLGVLSQYIFGPVLFLLSLFIIAVILLQRGKGGGLTGALGGLGGQSAFGVKAGDTFTRITAVAVLLWIFVSALACRWYLPEKLDIKADVGASSSIGSSSRDSTTSDLEGSGLGGSGLGGSGLGGSGLGGSGLGGELSPPTNITLPPTSSIEPARPETPASVPPATPVPAAETLSPDQKPVEPPSVDPSSTEKQP
jgi:preprotein translocase subunit SecG